MREALEAIFDLTHRMGNDYTNPNVEHLKRVHFSIASLTTGVLEAVKMLDKAKEV